MHRKYMVANVKNEFESNVKKFEIITYLFNQGCVTDKNFILQNQLTDISVTEDLNIRAERISKINSLIWCALKKNI